MDYQELKQAIRSNANRDLVDRKVWYSAAAAAYNQARPRYPKALIAQAVAIAQITSDSRILEVGCGPATATTAFAPIGSSMLCLEPNPDFYALAQQNCQPYANVEIQNVAFEEWPIATSQFDAVLAASSFHWIPSEIGYPKAANALKENGYLILLWNKELQPAPEVQPLLSEVYQAHAPALDRYEDRETQIKILQGLGQMAIDSHQFKNVVFSNMETEITYTVDQYLTLLSTYSPYLKLNSETRKALFAGLRDRIESHLGGQLQLFLTSAFHIAQKA